MRVLPSITKDGMINPICLLPACHAIHYKKLLIGTYYVHAIMM